MFVELSITYTLLKFKSILKGFSIKERTPYNRTMFPTVINSDKIGVREILN
jgi:hypothetical protein